MLLDQDRQSLITVRGGYKSKARGGGGVKFHRFLT